MRTKYFRGREAIGFEKILALPYGDTICCLTKEEEMPRIWPHKEAGEFMKAVSMILKQGVLGNI